MNTYGKAETEKLKENLENQLDRLMQQLNDLESCRDEVDATEYDEIKQETMEQLKEFNENLEGMVKGDISLVNSLGAIKLATQAAISEAFHTPEVIRLFGRREPKRLRERLNGIEHEFKLGKLSDEALKRQKGEILTALRQLGDKLTPPELQFLEEWTNSLGLIKGLEFQKVSEDD